MVEERPPQGAIRGTSTLSQTSSVASTRVNSPTIERPVPVLDVPPPETSTTVNGDRTEEGTMVSIKEDKEQSPLPKPELDVEHVAVKNDPRLWSRGRKSAVLSIIAFTAMGGTITANVFFPALADLQKDLHASDGLLSATVSLFILGQGVFPMIWSGISEIKGRKMCYIGALVLYCTATAVCSRANSIGLFLGMRILQSIGSSAVLALGAGTLADIYDVHERGTKLGVFYGVPLLGPSLGPIIGGSLTAKYTWRSTFYFLLAFGGVCLVCMIWLPETFRKERSLAWRLAMKRARQHAREEREKARSKLPGGGDEGADGIQERQQVKTAFSAPSPSQLERGTPVPPAQPQFTTINRVLTGLSLRSGEDNVKIHFRDVNPLAAVGIILRQKHNTMALLYSGFLFASQYSVTFSASRSFAAAPYSYGSLVVGLILLSFGVGNFIGSVGGGRWSDIVFARLKEKNGGVGEPEMRIKSTVLGLIAMPPFLIAYAWVVQKETPVYVPTIMLFFVGLATIWIYSSTLAYLVDANPGRASSAVACNSLFRGVLAAAASQAAEPITDRIGNGWYYTAFAFVLLIGEGGLLLTSYRGKQWREDFKKKEEDTTADGR
ncbi:MFS general substrate transporter [Meredithblackwellia eburnea MCA 4105]